MTDVNDLMSFRDADGHKHKRAGGGPGLYRNPLGWEIRRVKPRVIGVRPSNPFVGFCKPIAAQWEIFDPEGRMVTMEPVFPTAMKAAVNAMMEYVPR